MRYVQGGVESNNTSEGVLANLRASLQLLASAAPDQIAHFLPPDFTNKADETALDYQHWSTSVQSYQALSDQQKERLKALNDYLERLSGEDNAAFWTDRALLEDPRWEVVRTKAREALTSFGWEVAVPPRERYADEQYHE